MTTETQDPKSSLRYDSTESLQYEYCGYEGWIMSNRHSDSPMADDHYYRMMLAIAEILRERGVEPVGI